MSYARNIDQYATFQENWTCVINNKIGNLILQNCITHIPLQKQLTCPRHFRYFNRNRIVKLPGQIISLLKEFNSITRIIILS